MNATGDGKAPVIFVVDDDPVVRFMAREALEKAGFVVAEASDGTSAVEMFAQVRPAVVMLDIVMPGMDGFEVCAAIRRVPAGIHTPIVMMTGLDDGDSINRAFEVGATTFITKPIHCAILTHRLRYILRTKETEDQLRDSQVRFAKAQSMARLGHWHWDLATDAIHCSPSLAGLFGLGDGEQVLGHQAFLALIDEADRAGVDQALRRTASEMQGHSVEYAMFGPDGDKRIIVQEADAVVDETGVVEKVVGIAQDITERRAAEDRIRSLAFFDGVTGLPNRAYLTDILAQSIAAAERHNRELAVLFLDIDHFKRINDTLGHGAGDIVLQDVARRLVQCIRGADRAFRGDDARAGGGADAVARNSVSRLGGDEFVVVLGEVRRAEDSAAAARRIVDVLAEPLVIGGDEIRITVSIGISVFPVDGTDVESLLKNADTAMYHAKDQGRDRCQFFTSSLNERAVKRFSLETSLRKALEREEFLVYYQPKIDMRTSQPCGMEALIRWRRPDGKLVPPLDFIPVAEETGLIVPIGEWVLRKACAQAASWAMQGFGPLKVSVNLSAAQFRQPDLVKHTGDLLRASALAPDLLELELTEGILVEDTESSIAILTALKALGLSLSIDDFGTGYSSLSYLKKFPLSALKIDRSFVRDLAADTDDAAIVTATIALAHSLRLDVIAEGVETEEQYNFLRSLGCDQAQGYLFSPPVPADEFRTWLAGWTEPVALPLKARS